MHATRTGKGRCRLVLVSEAKGLRDERDTRSATSILVVDDDEGIRETLEADSQRRATRWPRQAPAEAHWSLRVSASFTWSFWISECRT